MKRARRLFFLNYFPNGRSFCCELNHLQTDAALRQIKEKDYAAPYRGKGDPIHLIGIEFSKTKRALLNWDVETEPTNHAAN